MIIHFIKENQVLSLALPQKIQGQYWISQYNDLGEKKDIIAIEGINNQWVILKSEDITLNENNDNLRIEENEIYKITYKNKKCVIFVESNINNQEYIKYSLDSNVKQITIGRSQDNTIQINNSYVSSHHASIFYLDNKWWIADNNSTNGTFLNNRKIIKEIIKPGDHMYIFGIKILIGKGFLNISIQKDITFINGLERYYVRKATQKKNEYQEKNAYFSISPRFKRNINTYEIQVDSPPENQNKNDIPLLLIVGPALTMGVVSIVSLITAIITKAIPTMVMSLSMLLGTVFWPLITKKYEKRRKVKKESQRVDKYTQYLNQVEQNIRNEMNIQKEILLENFLSIEQCEKIVLNVNKNLWERNSRQDDFLKLRIGCGSLPMDIKLLSSKKSFSLEDDILKQNMYDFCENEKYLNDVPITLSFYENEVSGIVGESRKVVEFVKGLVLQICTYYSYEDVKIIFLFDKYKNSEFDFIKWLPHSFDDEREFRFIANDKKELKDLSNYFENIIEKRSKLSLEEMVDVGPHYVIFGLDKNLSIRCDFITKIHKLRKNIHMSIVHITESINLLPRECKTVVELTHRSAFLHDLADMTGTRLEFTPDIYVNKELEMLSKHLLNIRLNSFDNQYHLPTLITFLQMYGIGKIEHLNSLEKWKDNDPTLSLAAPVGVDMFGDTFKLDLHQNYHGPHGLIAGMTGSGKSEFIMTYILSLAVNYHPQEVSFILIDYKGGGMAETFQNLPHTVGIITNLDGSSINRSLVSIESELKRRQTIFHKTSQESGINNLDIYKYQKMYREGKVAEPLPHLFIISDEFAELKNQKPEFMDKLISAARIGRSLGIHLILATQKPSGVVDDQIWSNSRFRICLKVQEKSDSMDMIKRAEAAEIKETGRFYLQVGYNELFETGQSAWAGAPYYPSDYVETDEKVSVEFIDCVGRVFKNAALDKRQQRYINPTRQMEQIVLYLNRIAQDEQIVSKKLWLDEIPKDIYYNDLLAKYNISAESTYKLSPIIGEFDDPSNQCQGLYKLLLSEKGNTIIFGGANSGKTMLISTIIYSLISQYESYQVQFYLLDFASETLKSFEEAPHIGDVILSNEAEKVKNLIKLLKKEIRIRKKKFVECGGNIQSYNNNSKAKINSIIVIIHNYPALKEIYGDYEEELRYLIREGNRYGIYFIVTSTSITSIGYNIMQYFNETIVLQMNDISDYNTILGKTNGLYPMSYEGRGLMKKDNLIYEFQTSHLPKNITDSKSIRQYCAERKESSEVYAKHIPILPKVVDRNYMKEYCQNDYIIPVGINKNTLEVVYYDIRSNYVQWIIGTDKEYIDVIKTLLLMMNSIQEIYIFDVNERLENTLSLPLNKYEETIDYLYELVLNRNNKYKETKRDIRSLENEKEVCIFFDSMNEVFENIDEERQEKLSLILEKGIIEYKVYIFIGECAENITSISYSTWFKKVLNHNNLLWCGNGFNDQYTFNIPAARLNIVNSSNGEGYFVQNKNVIEIKYVNDFLGDEDDG